MSAVHRLTDLRICGAVTIVIGQSSVYANNLLIAVNGDPNSHGAGNLIAGSRNVFINNLAVVNNTPDLAIPDGLCIPIGGPHCAPITATGSPNVFVGD